MPKVRDILVHVSVETAERRRRCYRKQEHNIPQGQQCLVIRTGPTHSKHNYCRQCAPQILDLAEKRLAEIKGSFAVGPALADGPVDKLYIGA